MSAQKIAIDTITSRYEKTCDQLSAYQAVTAAFGKENAFILESLSGPSRDRRMSIIGTDPLVDIKLYEDHAVLVGEQKLCAHLLLHLHDKGFAIQDKAVFYRDKDDAWNILRAIRDAFTVQKGDATHTLSYFGYFSYDTIRFIENVPNIITQKYNYPIIAVTIFQTFLVWHPHNSIEIIINNCALWEKKDPERYSNLLDSAMHVPIKEISYPADKEVATTITPERYKENVETALQHIRVGDIYQLQLGHEIHIKTAVEPFTVYHALRQSNPSPYMYLAHLGGIDLVGASPELYVRLEEELIEMRPIAGTVGKKAGIDREALIRTMTESQKERAEHVMLVDLCRNDIGRVCKPGSLEVDELMVVEEYSHLFHMVSNVQGLLRKGNDAFDVMKATFPAGTMTGAPKVRAMELIESFETSRRGIYAGAVGLIGLDDTINTALCIRSTFRQNGVYHLRASAGIVNDSEPEKEWMETLYKMSSVYRAVTGEELIK